MSPDLFMFYTKMLSGRFKVYNVCHRVDGSIQILLAPKNMQIGRSSLDYDYLDFIYLKPAEVKE